MGEWVNDRELLNDLYEWALKACHQGTGAEYGTPEWHCYISVWEDAETLFPQIEARLRIPVKENDESRRRDFAERNKPT